MQLLNDPRMPDRFWQKIQVDPVTGCWLWMAYRHPQGYGMASDHRRRRGYVHRWSYMVLVGPIPDGLHIDHLCRVRSCANPDHLEPVTPRENVLRGISPAAEQKRQTHCIHGHEFTPENTYLWHGHRACKACAVVREQQRTERRRAGGFKRQKLTADVVREIRQGRLTDEEYAQRFGASVVTIRQARLGVTWKAVNVPPRQVTRGEGVNHHEPNGDEQ